MKKRNHLFLLLGIISLGGCTEKVVETLTYTINEPVFMSKEMFRSPVKVTSDAKPISKQGKICFYEGYIYISEPEAGIHIINDKNPSDPKNAGFIELVGNTDLAIRNNVLYADSYVDLVWFDISSPSSPKEMGRKKDMFPNALPATGNFYGCDWEAMQKEKETSIIVGWKEKDITVAVKKNKTVWWGWERPMTENMIYTTNKSASFDGSATGANGSMSRFTFSGDYLYSVFQNQMNIFKFNGVEPEKAAENMYIGGNVETIFSYKSNLFMGTPTGMLIYSITNPLAPVYQSRVSHAYGCDPVVVENDKAYVTVHSGNTCGQNENTLFIVDVSDVKNPKEIASYAMTNPKGLGIENETLFLCDNGLKVFNAANPQTIIANQIKYFKNIDGYDLIPLGGLLVMIGADGIYQYDYTTLTDIKLLGKLSFAK